MRGSIALGLLLASAGCRDGLRAPTEADAAEGADATGADAEEVDAAMIDAAMIDAAMIDAAAIDAAMLDAVAIDAPIDAPGPCVLTAGATPTQAARCGGAGGSTDTTLACGVGRVAVGMRVAFSDGTTANGGRSSHGVTLVCGSVDATGSGMATNLVEHTATGTGASGWTPSTPSQLATCQPGWVMSGVRAFTGPMDQLLANLSIDCAKVDADGTFSGQQVTFSVGDSGTITSGPSVSACTGAMVGLIARTGAGVDSITPLCAPLVCAP